MKISVVDYGMGNIRSVTNALRFLGAEPFVVDDPVDLEDGKIIIPGVGAFGDAMDSLRPFLPRLEEAFDAGIPILGICLGMQVFFETSDESPDVSGLGFLKGKVTRPATKLNLPHIGWNSIDIRKRSCPLFDDVKNGFVYYAHSYHVVPDDVDVVVAASDYGAEITASIWRGNVFGTQFHPEKSGKLGLRILQNFLEA